ncbi:hypothetical protein BVC80_1831g261 [Macleaya cordata]|uniref:Uncharacterized protein n=1 Tax=Macleaya cordata TaxID=56857 RepID=A0A200R7M9_MACCD|nr:hypothetical protein BVC80_1831g261 [Macleaya cordata]
MSPVLRKNCILWTNLQSDDFLVELGEHVETHMHSGNPYAFCNRLWLCDDLHNTSELSQPATPTPSRDSPDDNSFQRLYIRTNLQSDDFLVELQEPICILQSSVALTICIIHQSQLNQNHQLLPETLPPDDNSFQRSKMASH